MIKEIKFKIDGKNYTMQELTTRDVIRLFSTDEGLESLLGLTYGNPESYKKLAKIKEEGFDIESATEGFSNMKIIMDAFEEVNRDFLEILPERINKIINMAKRAGISSKSTAG